MTLTLIKTNAYAARSSGPTGTIVLVKTNAYGTETVDIPLVPPPTVNQFQLLDGDISEVFPLDVSGGDGAVVVPENPFLALRDMERNPYRAHMGDGEAEVAQDFREQQRVIRQQHNLTQAGDSTFDYGLLLKSYPSQEFTLGSAGRFFHDDYGLIEARYVKFKGMVSHPYQGQPVGRILDGPDGVDWIVTNDITLSDPELILGFTFLAELPPDDYYGWAVVRGCNPSSIRVATAAIPAQNDAYSWTATGNIELAANGRIVGRRWGLAFAAGLPAGALFITLEGPSLQDLIDLIAAETAQIVTDLAALEGRVSVAESTLQTHGNSLAELALTDASLLSRIEAEETIRALEINAIRDSIGAMADFQTIIDDLEINLTQLFQAGDNFLQIQIDNLSARIDANDLIMATWNYDGLRQDLINLTNLIGELTDSITVAAASGGILPVVDGSIPPTFIQNPDGSLVFTEIT